MSWRTLSRFIALCKLIQYRNGRCIAPPIPVLNQLAQGSNSRPAFHLKSLNLEIGGSGFGEKLPELSQRLFPNPPVGDHLFPGGKLAGFKGNEAYCPKI